jgi:hypothetical protein
MSHRTGTGLRRVAIGLLVALPALTVAACSSVPPGHIRALLISQVRARNAAPSDGAYSSPMLGQVQFTSGDGTRYSGGGAAGWISLTVPPGRYTVRGVARHDGRCQNKPKTVTVRSGRNNPIHVDCLRYVQPDA